MMPLKQRLKWEKYAYRWSTNGVRFIIYIIPLKDVQHAKMPFLPLREKLAEKPVL